MGTPAPIGSVHPDCAGILPATNFKEGVSCAFWIGERRCNHLLVSVDVALGAEVHRSDGGSIDTR